MRLLTNALLEDGTGLWSSNISTLCFQTVPAEARMEAVEKTDCIYGSITGIVQMYTSWSAKITRAHYCVLLLSAHSHLWCELAPVLSEHTAFPQLLPHPFQTSSLQLGKRILLYPVVCRSDKFVQEDHKSVTSLLMKVVVWKKCN